MMVAKFVFTVRASVVFPEDFKIQFDGTWCVGKCVCVEFFADGTKWVQIEVREPLEDFDSGFEYLPLVELKLPTLDAPICPVHGIPLLKMTTLVDPAHPWRCRECVRENVDAKLKIEGVSA